MKSSRPLPRLPSLDGLRAISILFVLIAGLGVAGGDELRLIGIRGFFVIAGYLAASQLMREHLRTGTIAIGAFYGRRALRILPPMAVLILAVCIAALVGAFRLAPWDVFHATTLTMNYNHDRAWQLGHLWSIAAAAQLFVLFPLIVLVAGPRHLGKAAVAMLFIAPALRMFVSSPMALEALPCVMDSFAAGVVFAAYGDRVGSSLRYHRFLRSRWFAIVPAGLLLGAVDPVLGITAQNLCLALIVERCVHVRRDRTHRILNARPIAWLGAMSYSLYLWQAPFLDPTSSATLASFPLNLGLALLFATVSYFAIERPFHWLRQRRASRNRRIPGPFTGRVPA